MTEIQSLRIFLVQRNFILIGHVFIHTLFCTQLESSLIIHHGWKRIVFDYTILESGQS